VRDAAAQVPGPGLARVTGTTTEALSFFIESELNHRQAERYQAVDLQPEVVAFMGANGQAANERGLEVLRTATAAVGTARENVADLRVETAEVARLAGEFHREVRANLADSELKVDDIKRLDAIIAEVVDATRAGSLGAAVDQIERGLGQLDDVRRQPNRGAVENFPLWKIGGLIVLLGVGIIFFIHCGIFGCDITSRDSYITALIVTALITLGC
jgi:hypothetical protein